MWFKRKYNEYGCPMCGRLPVIKAWQTEKIPREPQSKDNTHSLPAPMSTWTYLYKLVQPRRTRTSRQWKELVDEYKGKDTK